MSLTSAAILLFFVMDPLGNIPVFLSALRTVPPERTRKVIVRELLIALIVLLGFMFLGRYAMNALDLTEPALGIAGGVVLALIALRMIFPSREHSLEEEVTVEPFIVPLAIPYVAGPSAMAMVMLLMSREPQRWLEWLVAILLAWGASVPIILAGARLRGVLGERGLVAIERLMGLVLITIAVQMLLNGVTHYLAHPG
jgi:multiple antibiotic resistance protein